MACWVGGSGCSFTMPFRSMMAFVVSAVPTHEGFLNFTAKRLQECRFGLPLCTNYTQHPLAIKSPVQLPRRGLQAPVTALHNEAMPGIRRYRLALSTDF